MAGKILSPEEREAKRIADRERLKKWRQENPEKVRQQKQRTRKTNSEKIKKYMIEWRKSNPDKTKQHSEKWRKSNPDKISKTNKEQREKNKEEVKKYKEIWYNENKERLNQKSQQYYENNKEAMSLSAKEWREKNPEVCRAAKIKRKAHKLGNGGSHTGEDTKALFVAQKKKCAICFVSIKQKYHVDHIMPLKLGGTNNKENLQLTCPICNQKKHSKNPFDYAKKIGRLL